MVLKNSMKNQTEQLLLDPTQNQRSNCGVGVLMDFTGDKSHELIEDALELLENLDHRGARGAEPNTGDGAGILLQKTHDFLEEVMGFLKEDPRAVPGVGFGPPGAPVIEVLQQFQSILD